MRRIIFISIFIAIAIILVVISCKRIVQNCNSESSQFKNRIAKSWKLNKVLNNNCLDNVDDDAWILELSRSGDCYSISNNIFGEKEAEIGKWDLVNDGKTLQINNYFLTSKPIFISTWYKILKLSDNELCLESLFSDKEVFHFIRIQK